MNPTRLRKVLFGLLRWIAEHVRGFYSEIGVFLLLGLGITFAGLLLFMFLAEAVAEGQTRRFDEAIMLWVNARATPQLNIVALEVTTLADAAVVWVIVMISSAFLWVTRNRYWVFLLWAAVLGGNLLSSTLKMTFDRPRPDLFEWIAPYAGLSSFPSGHSTTAMVFYTTLAYMISRLESTRRLRIATYLIASTIIILIGISRVYLGVHYPSDVVAGFLIGLVWATVCAVGLEAIQYFRARNPSKQQAE